MTGRDEPRDHAAAPVCYLTTTGRGTGRPHEIEIGFAFPPDGPGRTLYMLTGGGARADWVRNLRRDLAVTIRLGDNTYRATALVVSAPPEDTLARRLLCAKYQGWREGRPLSAWGRTALPVACDLAEAA